MEKEEILNTVKKKTYVREMEKVKINKSCWIGNVVACFIAVTLIIIEGVFDHFTSIYAIAMVCFSWASVFYLCQFFIARRLKGLLIGGILDAIGAIIMLVLYILTNMGVL